MNMPRRQDEIELWNAFGPGAPYGTVRDAHVALGMDTNRALYLVRKWESQRIYDVGTSELHGWKTDAYIDEPRAVAARRALT